ncbi:MAG: suppressor of fused domain protein [Leptospirales bacterium]|nr:suppressor of fused domain protein [Leptospirales bacterium]
MAEPTLLLEELSPYGTRAATLEDDGRSIYLYLSPVDDYPGQTRAVWVRNLLPGPAETDSAAMREGRAPLLRSDAVNHPEGRDGLRGEDCDLVWFQEGSGVSLYFQGEPLAILPPWSGADGLQGYARDCLIADAGTLPFPPGDSSFFERLEENLRFWTERSKPEHWAAYRDRLLANYETVYGKHRAYYALQDRRYPPIGIAEFAYLEDGAIYATVGMSYQHMPGVERQTHDVERYLRSELICPVRLPFSSTPGLVGRMAVYPWIGDTWIGPGHTFESGMRSGEADFAFTDDFDLLAVRRPAELIVDERYLVHWTLGVPISSEYLAAARTRGPDHAIRKYYGL